MLGVICEVSLKVLPVRPATATLCFDCDEGEALEAVCAGPPSRCRSTPAPGSRALARAPGRRRAAVRRGCAGSAANAWRPAAAALVERAARSPPRILRHRRDGSRRGESLWRLSVPSSSRAAAVARRAVHRMGRRAALVAQHGRRIRGARRGRRRRRTRHADARRRQIRRRLHALERAVDAHPSRLEAGLRSAADLQSRASVRRLLTPMQTQLSPEFKDTLDGEAAAAILRKCVHCGFCNATCPTYQLLGDELDGPRGRIYLIKQVLEGARGHAQHAAASGPLPDLPVIARRPVRAALSTAISSISAARSSSSGSSARRRESRALVAQGGADLAAVRAGDHDGPERCGRCCRGC